MSGVLITRATTPIGERLVRSLVADENIGHVLAVGPHPPHRALPFAHPSRLTYLQSDLSRTRAIRSLLYGPVRDLGIGERDLWPSLGGSAASPSTSESAARCPRVDTNHRSVGGF